ncbi:MAG TPA: hypothetical protein VKS22_12820 [Candidatus Binataceae bacterium]|nr:hypothetical protein [Candidatus Binataceae bacterium]
MNKPILGLIAIALTLGLAPAHAQDANSGPTTKTLTAKVTTGVFPVPTAGECIDAGFASRCPSGNCECFSLSGVTVSGSMAGKGTADVFVTEDFGNQVPTTGLPHQCNPEYVDAVLTTTLKKTPLTETVSLLTVSCHELKTGGKATVTGGFGIEAGASNGATGWGTATGTFDKTTQVETLTLKGSITQ